MSLLAQERALYEGVWTGLGGYGTTSPGEQLADMFASLATTPGASVLDAGCGSGKGAIALAARGYRPTLCDVTNAGLVEEAEKFPFFGQCLWHYIGGSWDYVYCTDVLEHVQPQFTMLAVSNLLRCASRGLFLSVCNQQDAYGAYVGKPLHACVQPFTWWRDSLRELGRVTDARDLVGNSTFFVEPLR